MEIGINDNQEDSIVNNKSSTDRGFMRAMSVKKYDDVSKKSTQSTTEDEFGIKDKSLVKGINENERNYNKYNDKGFAPEETKIENGDIIIAKVSPISDGEGKLFRDESQAYKSNADGYVDKVWAGIQDGDGYNMIKMRIRSERTSMVGDKFCLTPDHEVLTSNGWMRFDTLYKNYNMHYSIRKDMKVAQKDANDNVEFVSVQGVFEFDFDGQMYKLQSEHIEYQATPDHMLYVKKSNSDKFELCEAKKVFNEMLTYKTDNKEVEVVPSFGTHKIVPYTGKVYCLQVPTSVFLVRYNDKVHWTGNCSRHGKLFA